MAAKKAIVKAKTFLRRPYWQNFIVGILIGLTGGLYVALNLLGAGGGKPNSASTINTANAVLCATYAVVALFGGAVLNKLGPSWTAFFGVIGYIVYIGSLWHFDGYAVAAFPLFGAVCLGTSAGFIYVTQGYISMSYSEERERGKFVSIALNLQALGAVVGGIIPLIINRDKAVSAGVPAAVYIIFIVMDFVGAAMSQLLTSPKKVIRPDGTNVAEPKARTFMQELKGVYDALNDWKIWILLPGFLPGQVYLVYCGSVNVYINSLRARSLLSFCAVTIQMFAGFGLQYILDHPKLSRKNRALAGLLTVGLPLLAAWIWECVRVRNYDRSNPPTDLVDWSDPEFAAGFILFVLNWTSSALWQYIMLYFLGCFTNDPRKAANNAGVFRCFVSIGEAVGFGVDSRQVSYLIQAAVILVLYFAGFCAMGYLAIFTIEDSKYFQEDEVTIPVHVKEEHEAVTEGPREEEKKDASHTESSQTS